MYVRNDQIRSELSWHFNKLPTNETLKKIQGSNRIGSHDLYHTNAMLLATELHCIKPKIGSKVKFEVMLSWKGVKWKVYENLEYTEGLENISKKKEKERKEKRRKKFKSGLKPGE